MHKATHKFLFQVRGSSAPSSFPFFHLRCLSPRSMTSRRSTVSQFLISSPFTAPASTLLCCRSFSSTTYVLQSATDVTAMEVAMEVNKLKKAHQASAGPVKKEIEKEAWACLQKNLSDNSIQKAEGKAVALLLNSWAYFAKFWEKGKDGPILPDEPTEEKNVAEERTESP